MDIERIPRSVPKPMIPGLKLSDLVQLKEADYSQAKDFSTKFLPGGTVGRVTRIYDFGKHIKFHRFLVYIRIPGHPRTTFYTEELVKVRA